MRRHESQTVPFSWLGRVRQFNRAREPLLERIREAHDAGDFEERDRLVREVEKMRRDLGLR